MKKIIITILAFFIYQNSFAEKITAEGYGMDSTLALLSAKRNAIAKSSGEFIDSKEVLRHEQISKELQSVTYGVVRNFDILEKYNEETRKIVILAEVDKTNTFFADNNKSEKLKLKKETIREMSQAALERVNAVKDLYKDLNDIYDIKVEKVTIGMPIGEKYTYFVTISMETKESWLKKREELEKVIGNFDLMTKLNPGCSISAHNFRFVDQNNEIRIVPVNLKSEKGKSGVIIGEKARYEDEYMLSSYKEIEEFNFKLILFESRTYHKLECFVVKPE
jgi:hypothetical protein